jgi:hypothetical protein
LGITSWKKDHFEVKSLEAVFTRIDERIVLNVREPKSESIPQPRWSFFVLSNIRDTEWVMIPPRVDAFMSAVEKGELPGEIVRGVSEPADKSADHEAIAREKIQSPPHRPSGAPATAPTTTQPDTANTQSLQVVLKADSAALEDFISKAGIDRFFASESPLLLKRVADQEDDSDEAQDDAARQ